MSFRRHKNTDPAFQIEDRDALVNAFTKLGNTAVRPTTDSPYEHITVVPDPVPAAAEIEAVRSGGETTAPSAIE